LNVLVLVMDGLFRNVYEDDCKICVINYDGDLQKYNYLYYQIIKCKCPENFPKIFQT
jgi:hypothetical protein